MGVLTMTMDTQSFQAADLSRGPRARAAYWGSAPPSPPSPPARGSEAPVVASRRPRSRSRTRSRSRSPRTASSECSPDRLCPPLAPLQAPFDLRDGMGVFGYPFYYPYGVCETVVATPTSPGPPPIAAPLGADPLGPLGPLDALSDLYAPLQSGYPHPLRPWLPWRGLSLAPLAAPASVSAAPAAPALGTALKFGMDRILSEVGCGPCGPCGPCATASTRGTLTGCSRELTPFGMSALLTPSPLRAYGHVGDARPVASPPRGAGPHAALAHGHGHGPGAGAAGKRKRSWSRAVFSNLQRKGLEKRFQLQKYITKPDRRQLAATLGLTDAQVKVWFQNRRMKWRHTKESKQQPQPQLKADGLPDLQQDASECDASGPA